MMEDLNSVTGPYLAKALEAGSVISAAGKLKSG